MSLVPFFFRISLLLAGIVLSSCGTSTFFPELKPGQSVELATTPYYPQKKYHCGPAALAMLLGASGVRVQPDDVAPFTFLPQREGSLQLELIAGARRYGRIPYRIDPDVTALLEELRAGRPVLVLQNLGLDSMPSHHYAVVIGAAADGKMVLRSGAERRLEMPLRQFLLSWVRPGSWGIILLRPGELPVRPDPERYLEALVAFEAHAHVDQAAEAYRAALKRWPRDEALLFAWGNAVLQHGDALSAERVFRAVLDINPDHVAAANNLALLLAARGCVSQAGEIIRRAVEAAGRLESPLAADVVQTMREIDVSAMRSNECLPAQN